jgi:hypothetical protein
MRTALEKILRGKLEKTVEKAREIVEVAVTEALTRLGISEGSAPSYLSEAERKLRTRLRAHGRQLGDVLHKETTSLVKANDQETELLINEMAYEHWHRMLFARFLEQSDLLMYEPGTPVTLDECSDLAEDEVDCKDGWELAGRLAQKMLPQIFRADSPVFEVKLSINHVNALEELIAALHPDTFQASDSLGWCYQFWQNKKKKQVNESGVKIGAKELSPVTQLFTEPYMVSFLLDNALGAWWAKRRLSQDDLLTATSEQELRELAAIPGVPLEYLRFTKAESKDEEASAHSPENAAWSLAAGDFNKWPEHLSELKTLDPCCGSGHFLVAKFLMLVPMRMELEALTAKQAIDKVISENIHGLELDQRCVELAAFALALEAWRYPSAGGYRQLPELQLACSGMSIVEAQKEWKNLAKDDEELQDTIKWMQKTFKDAPTLGSLIDPNKNIESGSKPWELIQQAIAKKHEISYESKAIAKGMAKSVGLLVDEYQWVITNVPYLVRAKQSIKLQDYCVRNYPNSKYDLATVFMEKALNMMSSDNGVCSIVLPQNWLFLSSYEKLRIDLLTKLNWRNIVKLGSGAFDTISGEVVKAILITFSNKESENNNSIVGIDASDGKGVNEKSNKIIKSPLLSSTREQQLSNSETRILLDVDSMQDLPVLGSFVTLHEGMSRGDTARYDRLFLEVNATSSKYSYFVNSPSQVKEYAGRELVINWNEGKGTLANSDGARITGYKAWNKDGVFIARTGNLKATLSSGMMHAQNGAVLLCNEPESYLPVWCYCQSEIFCENVRKLDSKIIVASGAFMSAPFDIEHWSQVAKDNYPYGLPQPYTNEPTQWLFHGHPSATVTWDDEVKTTVTSELRQDDTVLQVAVARLLGYQWPAELDAEMELAPEMREVLAKCKDFDGLVDDDGIVCIPAIRGEKPANDRLESILHAAYGDEWSATVLNNLLKSVKATNLTTWLRDKFFEQHSKLFQHRPFIWQIWDGLADGFSALVNYHTLDYKGLERLIYTYLDDWISTQIQLEKDEVEGAELRLSAARNLKESLEAILVGESNGKEGLDIFVRWKSLAEQPLGWNPDLNDGVRLNIRPFMQAKDVGKKEAGVLRFKPNIHWKKDRGTDVASAPWFDLGLEYGGKQGDRINDHHLTLAEKKAARDAK